MNVAFSAAMLKYKLVIYGVIGFAVVAIIFSLGFSLAAMLAEGEASKVKAAYLAEKLELTKLAKASEERARSAESRASTDLFNAAQTYEEVRKNENATADRRITDLLTERDRLRVRLSKVRTPAAGAIVPGTAATPSASDGEADETLAGPVAARLTQRYNDYNEVVDQLTLCQATVTADRAMFAPAPKP